MIVTPIQSVTFAAGNANGTSGSTLNALDNPTGISVELTMHFTFLIIPIKE
jgi:hypothetical protein